MNEAGEIHRDIENNSRKESILCELRKSRKKVTQSAQRNYSLAVCLLFLAVGSSAVATILGLLSFDSRIVGVIALVPTIAALFANAFKFQEKANWFYRKKDALDRLIGLAAFSRILDASEKDKDLIEEISQHWSDLNEMMSKEWEDRFYIEWTSIANSRSGARTR